MLDNRDHCYSAPCIVHCPQCGGADLRIEGARLSRSGTWISQQMASDEGPKVQSGYEGLMTGDHVTIDFLCQTCPEGYVFHAFIHQFTAPMTLEWDDADDTLADMPHAII